MNSRRRSPVDREAISPHLCSIKLRSRLIGGLPFFSGLPPRDMEDVNRGFVEMGYAADQYIYAAGDPAERFYVVANGIVKLFQTAANGQNVLLSVLSQGDFFGSLSVPETAAYFDTAQALTSTCSLSIPSSEFRKILNQHPEVALSVLELVSGRLNAAHERVFLLSSAPVEKRLAATLLQLAQKLGRKREIGLLINAPLSRNSLAEMVGSTPETTSRVMSLFQAEGVIRSGRQWVAIVDLEKLEKLAAS